ncbi:MAG TPA: ArsA-related P-loop ATPase [Myxococcota bacterium]|nr:ArsA-related P-loop ATPase [Myxococcota bacterium]
MNGARQTLDTVVGERTLIVCVGSGGVGKTTVAATIALWGAKQGRKVLVLTIDPARRLANSLGLSEFGNAEKRIDLSELDFSEGGELYAMMLDTRTTFDQLIRSTAPDEATARRILANPIYQTMSDTFAGSQEYMAAEKLHDVVVSGNYDLVVLDTPPVKNALDFFEAPGRLSRFMDRQVIDWFLLPPSTGLLSSVVHGTGAIVWRLLGYVFGSEFLGDLAEFLQLFKDMVDGFRERHERVLDLFRSNDTRFLTVCAPTEPSVEVAGFFAEELRKHDYPRGGLIVNQVHVSAAGALEAGVLLGEAARELASDLEPRTAASLVARLGAAHGRLRQQAGTEGELISRVSPIAGGVLVEVPRLEHEVHDLHGLLAVAGHLFEG